MASQALYLKYRPQTFEEVVGQEPITRTLRNALSQGRLRHAYLLTGPRGTGKTTTARLLAKAVNCLAPEEERPCNACTLCLALNEGRLLDLIEIDAASNRGIDEIRDIREKVGFRPNEGRFKIYVLDEAHMLTEPAFNALLKTLEEPPPHVIFALVTTDPHKIPATITSRCQRFDFRRIPVQAMVGRLAYVAEQEGLAAEQDALELIAQQGTGAMRDAISLLDQLASYGDEITLERVQMVLGTVAGEAAGKLADCLARGDVAGGLDLINRTLADGADPRQFGHEVVEYLRALLLIHQGAGTRLLRTTAEQAAQMEALAAEMPVQRLVNAIRLFNQAVTDLRRGFQTIPQLPLEMALVESLLDAPAPQPQVEATPPTPAPATGDQPPATAAETEPGADSAPAPAAEQAPVTAAGEAPVTAAGEAPVTAAGEAPATTAEETQAPASQVKESPSTAPAGGLSLAQMTDAWEQVLQAVRQRNPAAEGALRSGCQPVEVQGNEVIITFPYPFLRDKLGDPQRRTELQDALSEVMGVPCIVKLVLAGEYKPRPRNAPPANPENPAPKQTPAPASRPAAGATAESSDQAAYAAEKPDVPPNLSRWIKEHGGTVEFVDKTEKS
ncbi:MAG: DNA polymerase III subunit gamma/tau [Anaerolineae bacterium]|jgi:DNA polymerase-3 subunit gamma/tau